MAISGGRRAIAGFLYQTLFAAGVRAAADRWNQGDKPSDASLEWEHLLTLTRDGEVRHEMHESDIAILLPLKNMGPQECAIAQCKVSIQSTPAEIGPTELGLHILNNLEESTKKAGEEGIVVAHYFLITNRPLGKGAQYLLDEAKGQTTDNCVSADAKTVWAKIQKANRQRLLRDLKIVENACMTAWERELVAYGLTFGLFDDEITSGIDRLIGSILQDTSNATLSPAISSADITKAMTGTSAARPLSYAAVSASRRDGLPALPAEEAHIISREKLARLLSLATSTRALVVLYGQGGCGKTELLHCWGRRTGESHPAGGGACIRIYDHFPASRTWYSDLLHDWSGTRCRRDDRAHLDELIDRVRIANPQGTWPVVQLGLDGLDQFPERVGQLDREVIELLRDFYRRDRSVRDGADHWVTLVVTCRDRNQIVRILADAHDDPIRRHARTDSPQDDELCAIEVKEFDAEDFSVAVQKFADTEVGDAALGAKTTQGLSRLRALAAQERGLVASDAADPIQEQPFFRRGTAWPSVRLGASELVSALHHPALWRAFVRLDPSARAGVIEADAAAQALLAARYVHDFLFRADRRGATAGLDETDVHHVLRAVAERTSSPEHFPHSQWSDLARHSGKCTDIGYDTIYREALSWGIIATDGETWYWKHPFVHTYLRSMTAARGNLDD